MSEIRDQERPGVFNVPERMPPAVPLPSQDEPRPEPRTYPSRRRFLKWVIRAGYGAFALAFALPALALRALSTPKSEIAEGDRLVLAAQSQFGAPGTAILAADIPEGSGVQVFPENKTDNQSNLIEIVRIGAGQGGEGLVAYSAICTHLGCPVYAELNQDNNIACPCHNSQFNPREDASVIGGPANRPLPSLPITVDAEGVVVAAGGFSAPVGPE